MKKVLKHNVIKNNSLQSISLYQNYEDDIECYYDPDIISNYNHIKKDDSGNIVTEQKPLKIGIDDKGNDIIEMKPFAILDEVKKAENTEAKNIDNLRQQKDILLNTYINKIMQMDYCNDTKITTSIKDKLKIWRQECLNATITESIPELPQELKDLIGENK